MRRAVPKAKTAAPAPEAKPVQPAEPDGIPVLMATTNTMRNVVLPKLATMADVTLAGIADNPGTALKLLVQDHPEVVILDMDFGGPLVGLDTGKMMQTTRSRAGIIMLVPDLDVDEMRKYARRFGASWSYLKKTTAGRVDILNMVLKSASRGVQWVEPDLSRQLSVLWKLSEEARELEARSIAVEPAVLRSPTAIKNARIAQPAPPSESETDDDGFVEEEAAPGIKTMSTSDVAEGFETTTAKIGHGGIGSNVGKVRRSI